MTLASPGSLLAPEPTSASRQTLMAVVLTATTGCPASSRRSTRRPSGRSMATGSEPGSAWRARRSSRRSKPAAVWLMEKRSTTRPARIDDADGVLVRRPVDADVHGSSLVWQHGSGPEDISRAVTDWRSVARPSVAGPSSSGDRGRQCHAGPRGATDPGRSPRSSPNDTALRCACQLEGSPVTAPAVPAEGTQAPPPRRKRTPRKVLNSFLWYASAVVLALFIAFPIYLIFISACPRARNLLLPQVGHPQRSHARQHRLLHQCRRRHRCLLAQRHRGRHHGRRGAGHRRTGRLRHRPLRLPRARVAIGSSCSPRGPSPSSSSRSRWA